jgi:hypothetical protein
MPLRYSYFLALSKHSFTTAWRACGDNMTLACFAVPSPLARGVAWTFRLCRAPFTRVSPAAISPAACAIAHQFSRLLLFLVLRGFRLWRRAWFVTMDMSASAAGSACDGFWFRALSRRRVL